MLKRLKNQLLRGKGKGSTLAPRFGEADRMSQLTELEHNSANCPTLDPGQERKTVIKEFLEVHHATLLNFISRNSAWRILRKYCINFTSDSKNRRGE